MLAQHSTCTTWMSGRLLYILQCHLSGKFWALSEEFTLIPAIFFVLKPPSVTSLLFYCPHQLVCSSLTRHVSSSSVLQEVEDEAKWEEASDGREEAVLGARVHKNPRGGLWPQGAGGAAQRDRPQRMASQQQWVMIRVETQSLHEQFLMGIVKNVKDSYYLIYYVKILESSSVFALTYL